MKMAYGWENTTSTPISFNPNARAANDHCPGYQHNYNKGSEPKKLSDSQHTDPIPILDDGDSEPKEIIYIDVEDIDGPSTKDNYTAPIRQPVASNHSLGFPSLGESRSPVNNIQQSNSMTYTEKGIRPLFRTLAADEVPAQAVQTVKENRGIGFKAWYKADDSDTASGVAPAMLRNDISQSSSIILSNRERSKNAARSNRDEPQFAMSVLKSNRKRTMGELNFDELISPSQIESPSEKLARIAKKRRQRQYICDFWPHSTVVENLQTADDLEYVNRFGNDRATGGNVELAESPIENEQLVRRKSVARVGEERRGPSLVREIPPVNICQLTEGQDDQLTIQRHRDHRDEHENLSTDCSAQPPGSICDTQVHGDGTNVASLKKSHRAKNAKPRVSGPTNVCGVYSPEKKRPVKRSNRGEFHCPRCDSQFTTLLAVNYHFEQCIAKHGNPKSLKWNDHPSLERAEKNFASRNDNKQTRTVSALVPAVKDDPIDNIQDIGSKRKPELINNIVDLNPASNIQVSDPSVVPEEPAITPITEEQVSFVGNEVKFNDQTSIVEHRTTGGKGLSTEILKAFQETGSWDRGLTVDQSLDGLQDEETEVPNIAYRYFVQKREWLETEEDAIESDMGPYYTMNEANSVAEAEVKSPQIDEFEGIQSQGWSYYYRQDEHGMQMHMATVLGINIETTVHRELAPAKERVSIPKSAFVVAPRVYLVHELQWIPTSDDTATTAPTQCQSLTHGAFTLLKRANQRAAEEYLESLTGTWGNSEYDELRRTEAKSDLDKKVRGLNRDDGCFCEEIKLGSEGFAKVWVELVVVEGPRN